MNQSKEFHSHAEQQREKGQFLEALISSDRAMVAYIEEGNLAGFAEIQGSRFLTLRHLYEATENKAYLILAKHHAIAAVELAEHSGDRSALVMPLFNLAKAQRILNELETAVATYTKVVELMENNPPAAHNRPAVLADMKIQLGTCQLELGDQSALRRIEVAIKDLEATDEMKYNKDVWLSGAHMRLAEALAKSDPSAAQENLSKAKKIIDSNPDLTLREKQWQKLAEQLK